MGDGPRDTARAGESQRKTQRGQKRRRRGRKSKDRKGGGRSRKRRRREEKNVPVTVRRLELMEAVDLLYHYSFSSH